MGSWPAGLQDMSKTVVWGVSPDPVEDAAPKTLATDTPITTGQWLSALFGTFGSYCKPGPTKIPVLFVWFFPFSNHVTQCSVSCSVYALVQVWTNMKRDNFLKSCSQRGLRNLKQAWLAAAWRASWAISSQSSFISSLPARLLPFSLPSHHHVPFPNRLQFQQTHPAGPQPCLLRWLWNQP